MSQLRDSFENNLYLALQSCGFRVYLGDRDQEVVAADQLLSEHLGIAFSTELSTDQQVGFRVIAGDPEDLMGGEAPQNTLVTFFKTDSLGSMVVKIKKAMSDLVPELKVSIPDTVQDIQNMPTVDPKSVEKNKEKRKDQLLDQMLELPEGSPERKKIHQHLKALGALLSVQVAGPGLYRLSFDVELLGTSSTQFVDLLKQATAVNLTKVGELLPTLSVGDCVELSSNLDLVDTVYFSSGFQCGYLTPVDAVDMGRYKIAVRKGVRAVVNSIHGAKVHLIELSDVGTISAYDPIKAREITNQVQVHSCMVDLQNLRKVD